MTFDEALQRFEIAVRAVEAQHPDLREIARGARRSAGRIAERFRVDADAKRADRELATVLLDLAEAAERHESVQRDMPDESRGGPPSFSTLEHERRRRRGALGIADVGEATLSHVLRSSAAGALSGATSSIVRGTVLRGGNPVIRWLLDTFGGPGIDVDFGPVGIVTIYPFGVGNPVRAALVLAGAFSFVALASVQILSMLGGRRRAA